MRNWKLTLTKLTPKVAHQPYPPSGATFLVCFNFSISSFFLSKLWVKLENFFLVLQNSNSRQLTKLFFSWTKTMLNYTCLRRKSEKKQLLTRARSQFTLEWRKITNKNFKAPAEYSSHDRQVLIAFSSSKSIIKESVKRREQLAQNDELNQMKDRWLVIIKIANAFVEYADGASHQKTVKYRELAGAAVFLTASLLLQDDFSFCCWFDAWTAAAADVSSNNKQNVVSGCRCSRLEHWTAPRLSFFVWNNQMNIFCCFVLSKAPFCGREKETRKIDC